MTTLLDSARWLTQLGHRHSAAVVGLVLLAVLNACSKSEEPIAPAVSPPTSVVISPRAQVVEANATYSFVVVTAPANALAELKCAVAPTTVGTVSVSASGCTLRTSPSVFGGKLTATVGTKSDTALLVVFATGAVRR